jgi:hypothetical protein
LTHIGTSITVRREVALLAAAWGISPGEAVGRLVDHYHDTCTHRTTGTTELADTDVAVHRVYRGVRIEGAYHQSTRSLTVISEPLHERTFTSPSGARAAVVSALNPAVAPNGSGWDFWIITATVKTVASIRHRS